MADMEWPIISAYSRAQAIEDGCLIDISATAREAGIAFPLAITAAAWSAYVKVPAGCEGRQEESARLWDVVWMLQCAARVPRDACDEIRFHLHVATGPEHLGHLPPVVELKALCGPGDDGELVVTIMLPGED